MRFRFLFLICLFLQACGDTQVDVSTYEKLNQGTVIKPVEDFTTKALNAVKDENLSELKATDWSKIDLNKPLEDGKTFLYVAFEFERIRALRFLRALGAQSNGLIPFAGKSLTDLASALSQEQAALAYAITVNLEEEVQSLRGAVQKNNFKELKKFADLAADPNQFFDTHETLLTYAIKNKKSMAFRALLMFSDLDVNQKNKFEESPLKVAQLTGQSAIEAELIKRGAK